MVQWFLSFVLMVLQIVWEVEQAIGAGKGAEKKAEATKRILDHLYDKTQPVSLPTWVPRPVLDWLVGRAIETAVASLQGFFGK